MPLATAATYERTTGTSRSRSPSRYQSRGARTAVAPLVASRTAWSGHSPVSGPSAVAETDTRSTGSARRMPYWRACSSWNRATAAPSRARMSSPGGSVTSTAWAGCGTSARPRRAARRAARPRLRERRRRAARPPPRPPRGGPDRFRRPTRAGSATSRSRPVTAPHRAPRSRSPRRHVGRAHAELARQIDCERTAGAAEREQRAGARVEAAITCYLAHQHGHLVQRHAHHSRRRGVRVVVGIEARAQCRRGRVEVELEVAAEQARRQGSEHGERVGDGRQRAAASVAGRTGVGARAGRPTSSAPARSWRRSTHHRRRRAMSTCVARTGMFHSMSVCGRSGARRPRSATRRCSAADVERDDLGVAAADRGGPLLHPGRRSRHHQAHRLARAVGGSSAGRPTAPSAAARRRRSRRASRPPARGTAARAATRGR